MPNGWTNYPGKNIAGGQESKDEFSAKIALGLLLKPEDLLSSEYPNWTYDVVEKAVRCLAAYAEPDAIAMPLRAGIMLQRVTAAASAVLNSGGSRKGGQDSTGQKGGQDSTGQDSTPNKNVYVTPSKPIPQDILDGMDEKSRQWFIDNSPAPTSLSFSNETPPPFSGKPNNEST